MKPRDKVFLLLGIVLSAVFVRLGFWQLGRLSERKQLNSELVARAATAPVDVSAVPADTGAAHFRRVRLSGKFDFGREILLPNRSRNGSPGVNIITPLLIPGRDTAVLVNRGWVYSPDGMTVDLSRWREPAAMTGDAFVENFSTHDGDGRLPGRPNAFRWLKYPTISGQFPYAISPFYVVLISDGKPPSESVPPRLDVPPLDEGSHQNYAIQWFSFAAISIFGMILYVRRT